MSEQITERLYISTYSTGLGEKKARGKGQIGMRKTTEGLIEFSIGRGGTGYYNHPLVSAWATMDMSKAHELAMAILYLTGGNLPCEGEGVKLLKHNVNLSIDIDFKVDLCTILNKKDKVKEEVLAAVEKKLNDLSIDGVKEIHPK